MYPKDVRGKSEYKKVRTSAWYAIVHFVYEYSDDHEELESEYYTDVNINEIMETDLFPESIMFASRDCIQNILEIRRFYTTIQELVAIRQHPNPLYGLTKHHIHYLIFL